MVPPLPPALLCLSSPLSPGAVSLHSCPLITPPPQLFSQNFPRNIPPQDQWTLPVLLCPSKLNSSRVVGRGAYPESNVGKITLKTPAKSPLLAFFLHGGKLGGAELGWDEEGCSCRAEEDNNVPPDIGGLALSPPEPLQDAIIHMTQPLRNQHWKHVFNYQFYAEVSMVI